MNIFEGLVLDCTFAEIYHMTDIFEGKAFSVGFMLGIKGMRERNKRKEREKYLYILVGSIIRCMRRLEEGMREMCQAAKNIGNTDLEKKFAEGNKFFP